MNEALTEDQIFDKYCQEFGINYQFEKMVARQKTANSLHYEWYVFKTRFNELSETMQKYVDKVMQNTFKKMYSFNSNQGKRNFCKKIKIKETEKFISFKKLWDILKEEYR